jgi:peptidoglycan/xylan/chitin deacetylase (PgdA/CDA1 family)
MFRLDRFLTLYFFRFLAKDSRPNQMRIPILMYHSISDITENGVHPYYQVCTTPAVFESHMRFLSENNYNVISLDQAVRIFHSPPLNEPKEPKQPNEPNRPNRRDRPDRPNNQFVVLTFDDGFRDFITVGFPILSKYSFSATVFLPTGFIGDDRKTFKGRECLTWEEVRELQKKGVSFGSHSVNHFKMDELSEKDLRLEIEISKDRIEQETGERIEGFCYPFAFPEEDKSFVLRLREVLLKKGYKHGATTMIGRASGESDPYFLKRLPVNNLDALEFFEAKLNGGYDWLHTFQLFSKSFMKRGKRRAED